MSNISCTLGHGDSQKPFIKHLSLCYFILDVVFQENLDEKETLPWVESGSSVICINIFQLWEYFKILL